MRLEHLLSGEAEPEKRLEKTEFSLGTTRFVQYKKEGNNQSIIEMKKYIGAMKLAGSEHIAKTYEAHLKKLIEENS